MRHNEEFYHTFWKVTAHHIKTLTLSYSASLYNHPLFTKALSAALCNALSDIIVQHLRNSDIQDLKKPPQTNLDTHHVNDTFLALQNILKPSSRPEKVRSLPHVNISAVIRQALIAFAVRAPVAHYWYDNLERFFPTSTDSKLFSVKNFIFKVFVDQVIYAPALLLVNMFVTGVTEARPLARIWKKDVKQKFVSMLKRSSRIWLFLSLLQYGLVPVSLRVLVANIVSLLWSVYSAWKRMRSTDFGVKKSSR